MKGQLWHVKGQNLILKRSNLAWKRSNLIDIDPEIQIRPNLTIEFGLCNSKFQNLSEFEWICPSLVVCEYPNGL